MVKYLSVCLVCIGGLLLFSFNVQAEYKQDVQESIVQHFDEVDSNNDGKISQNEYLSQCKVKFQNLDVNNDGYLTKEEAEQTAAKVREYSEETQEERRGKIKEKLQNLKRD